LHIVKEHTTREHTPDHAHLPGVLQSSEEGQL
jgi:hypothetical protein